MYTFFLVTRSLARELAQVYGAENRFNTQNERIFQSFVNIEKNPQAECLAVLFKPPTKLTRRCSVSSIEKTQPSVSAISRRRHSLSTDRRFIAPEELQNAIQNMRSELGEYISCDTYTFKTHTFFINISNSNRSYLIFLTCRFSTEYGH